MTKIAIALAALLVSAPYRGAPAAYDAGFIASPSSPEREPDLEHR